MSIMHTERFEERELRVGSLSGHRFMAESKRVYVDGSDLDE